MPGASYPIVSVCEPGRRKPARLLFCPQMEDPLEPNRDRCHLVVRLSGVPPSGTDRPQPLALWKALRRPRNAASQAPRQHDVEDAAGACRLGSDRSPKLACAPTMLPRLGFRDLR